MGYKFSDTWLLNQSGKSLIRSLSSIPRLRSENNSAEGVISRNGTLVSALTAERVSALKEIPAESRMKRALRDFFTISIEKQDQFTIAFADVGVFTARAVQEMMMVSPENPAL
ncbi:hypothetical protein BGZ72_003650, partial [Mortierella alpina]